MKDWQFYVAVLLLVLLMIPIPEPLTQNEEAQLKTDIVQLKEQVNNLNSIYKPGELLDVSKKLNNMGKIIKVISNAYYPNVTHGYSIPFMLPEGTWLVTANGAWVGKNRRQMNSNIIFVSIHPNTPANPSWYGYNPEAAIEVAGNMNNLIRFQLSLTIINTTSRTSYLNIFLGDGGELYDTHVVGVQLK